MLERILPYAVAFASTLVLTLLLTPMVRELNRRLGMVDKPDPRRINKVPIPRGGGLALFLGVFIGYTALCFLMPEVQVMSGCFDRYLRCTAVAALMAGTGYADDKFSLSPKVKLLGQLIAAFLAWFWCDLGFTNLWPSIPAWLDCVLTVLWITGAVNAFNLIDGLDGLATGLALIATIGMAGALFCVGRGAGTVFYFAFAGGLLGFLRYNYNPASVFLGDCGSMYIGFVLSAMPLCSHAESSFLVSVGVPMLAMGVPIFDTSLAIFRRSIRRLLNHGTDKSDGKVMTADVDHLHHRILRSVGLDQRKAAWSLYALGIFLVAVGLVAVVLENRAQGLWIFAFTVATIVIFKDAARIELFDTGRLLSSVAHNRNYRVRRRWARMAVPFYVVTDVLVLVGVFFGVTIVLDKPINRHVLMYALPARVITIFFCLVMFNVYRTVWSRAVLSNYIRLLGACVLGSLIGSAVIYYLPRISNARLDAGSILYALTPFVIISGVRLLRSIIRDVFYAIDYTRLKGRKDVSRVLVYGAGLRYRAFRRELVRSTAANDRLIVGMIDDDVLLCGQYIGGIRIMGTLSQAPEIINETNADAVVVACQVTEDWKRVIRDTLTPTGVKVTYFEYGEKPL